MSESVTVSKLIWQVAKWGVFGLVLGFVAWHAWTLWNKLDSTPTHVHWGWLATATVVSVLAWLPSVWYWRWIMSRMGATAPWPIVTRAYYCGGLGKYLPGKAAVIVLRAALLRTVGVPATTAGLAVTHETLTCMWAGGLSIILLYPSLAPFLPEWMEAPEHHPVARYLFLGGCVLGGAAVLAMLLRSHRMLRGKFGKQKDASTKSAVPPVDSAANPLLETNPDLAANPDAVGPVHLSFGQSFRLTLAGGAVFLVDWWIQGLTLGLTLMAVIGERTSWSDWPVWTGAAAISLVGGFVVLFAPGGLGVREGLLLDLLEQQIGPREAVLVTVLWRGASLVGEFLTAGALYYGTGNSPAAKQQPPGH